MHQRNRIPVPSSVRNASGLDLSDDVVSLLEEDEPFVQHFLLVIAEILPFGSHVLGLGAR